MTIWFRNLGYWRGKKEKKRNHKAGKMAQWIRALTTIQRTRVQLPASTWQLVPLVTPVPEDPLPTSGLLQQQGCKWYTDIHTGETLIHMNFFKKGKEIITLGQDSKEDALQASQILPDSTMEG